MISPHVRKLLLAGDALTHERVALLTPGIAGFPRKSEMKSLQFKATLSDGA